jgi:hypothetical protein
MLIQRCWNQAEAETAKAVAEKYHSPNEEEVTFLFTGERRTAVEKASAAREVERAFLTDLRSISGIDDAVVRRGSGLMARVNLHGRQHEGRINWNICADGGGCIDWVLCSLIVSPCRRSIVCVPLPKSSVQSHSLPDIALSCSAFVVHCTTQFFSIQPAKASIKPFRESVLPLLGNSAPGQNECLLYRLQPLPRQTAYCPRRVTDNRFRLPSFNRMIPKISCDVTCLLLLYCFDVD